MLSVATLFINSSFAQSGIHSNEYIITWLNNLLSTVNVNIKKVSLEDTQWFYDDSLGQIVNKNHSFFQISGIQETKYDGNFIEQPIIIQDEIGYLGFICKEINGVLHFLVQAKIEPGNFKAIQLSTTIQATYSNFMQKHGGAKPPFLDYFVNAKSSSIVVDQLQSEQGTRYFKKRNRNFIVLADKNENIEEGERHIWMTLGQIKELLKEDNMISMNCRSVISCLPLIYWDSELEKIKNKSKDVSLINSILAREDHKFVDIYRHINNHKMFSEAEVRFKPLNSLKDWNMENNEFVCRNNFPFKIVFCNIAIDGREVQHWGQPLLEATGIALFGLFTTVINDIRYFLVHARHEIGTFDMMELGPTVQLEANYDVYKLDSIEQYFISRYTERTKIVKDILLSEEGGRFYHEQNKNIILEIDEKDVGLLPEGYFWLTYNSLNRMLQFNNIINIQLRNLLALLEI
jgi:oxidase EvaA